MHCMGYEIRTVYVYLVFIILIFGVTYPIHLLQYFANKVAPKIKTNSIMILDL